MGDQVKSANPRMDDWLVTVNYCENESTIMKKRIEELAARKAQLERVLTKEREKNVGVRAKIQALRAEECEQEEQEKMELKKIDGYNEALKASNAMLDKIRDREMELRKRKSQIVTEFEEDSCNIARRFQSLTLVDQDESDGSNGKAVMEDSVPEEEEKDPGSVASRLPLDEMKKLVQEVNVKNGNLKKLFQSIIDKEPWLKNKLQQMRGDNHF